MNRYVIFSFHCRWSNYALRCVYQISRQLKLKFKKRILTLTQHNERNCWFAVFNLFILILIRLSFPQLHLFLGVKLTQRWNINTCNEKINLQIPPLTANGAIPYSIHPQIYTFNFISWFYTHFIKKRILNWRIYVFKKILLKFKNQIIR